MMYPACPTFPSQLSSFKWSMSVLIRGAGVLRVRRRRAACFVLATRAVGLGERGIPAACARRVSDQGQFLLLLLSMLLAFAGGCLSICLRRQARERGKGAGAVCRMHSCPRSAVRCRCFPAALSVTKCALWKPHDGATTSTVVVAVLAVLLRPFYI